MSDPFLICHLVRGQSAFDIAEQIECTICQGTSCDECDEGHWWIIPTSGHRAYPYWSENLISALQLAYQEQYVIKGQPGLAYEGDPYIPDPPSPWPDHYAINNRALRSAPSSSLADRLGLNLRQPSAPIRRRV